MISPLKNNTTQVKAEPHLDAVPSAVSSALPMYWMWRKGFLRVKRKKRTGSTTKPCAANPTSTVMMYQPSSLKSVSGSSIDMMRLARIDVIPIGDNLHG